MKTNNRAAKKTPMWELLWKDYAERMRRLGQPYTAEDAFKAGFVWGHHDGRESALKAGSAPAKVVGALLAAEHVFKVLAQNHPALYSQLMENGYVEALEAGLAVAPPSRLSVAEE